MRGIRRRRDRNREQSAEAHRVHGPHSRQPPTRTQRRDTDRQNREHLHPDHRRKWVVHEAIGHEAVPAGVPEVVPERKPVPKKQRPLVRVRSEIDSSWPEPDEHARQEGRHCARCGPFADEQPTFLAAHGEKPTPRRGVTRRRSRRGGLPGRAWSAEFPRGRSRRALRRAPSRCCRG